MLEMPLEKIIRDKINSIYRVICGFAGERPELTEGDNTMLRLPLIETYKFFGDRGQVGLLM